MRRDMLRAITAAEARGWSAELTRSHHWRLRHPSGAILITGGTPSCWRALGGQIYADPTFRVEHYGEQVFNTTLAEAQHMASAVGMDVPMLMNFDPAA